MTWLALFYLAGYLLTYLLGECSARSGIRHARARSGTGLGDPVTLIKPVYGVDEFSDEAFRSWLAQAHPGPVQFVFSLQDPLDPALALLERLRSEPGLTPFEILVNPIRAGFNGKSSNLLHGVAAARYDILVFSDADIVAPPGTLSRLVANLQEGADVVGCMIRHTRPGDFWGGLYAFAWNVATVQTVGALLPRGLVPAIPGGTVALRRSALERIGGVESFGRFVAEDVAFSLRVARERLVTGLGAEVESPVGTLTRSGWFQKLSRLRIYRQLPGWPVNLVLVLVALTGYLALIPWALVSRDPVLLTACGLFLAGRAILWRRFTRLAEGRARGGLDFLVMDLTILIAGLGALVPGRVTWAGIRYEVDAKGRIVG